MNRLSTGLLSAVILALAVGSASAAMQGCPNEIVVGTEGAYPPFNYIDSHGNLQGFDVEIAKALCREIDARCVFKTQDWAGIIPGLLAKKYDAIVASMSITEERKKKVEFTQKYYQTPSRFVGRKGVAVTISEQGLKGKTVGVQRATTSEQFLRDQFGAVVHIKSYDKQDQVTLDLLSGRLDLMIADAIELQKNFLATPEGRNFEFKGPSFSDPKWFGEGIGIAVRPGDDPLRQCLNKAIEAIRADGTYAHLSNEWFGMDVYGD